jgi:hypothetical protein
MNVYKKYIKGIQYEYAEINDVLHQRMIGAGNWIKMDPYMLTAEIEDLRNEIISLNNRIFNKDITINNLKYEIDIVRKKLEDCTKAYDNMRF